MCLDELSKDRNNNLNIIRFIASVMVIVAHSYALAAKERDLLKMVSSGQADFGSLAVDMFFFYSGFLICRSVKNSQGICGFIRRRAARIFPPLFFVVCVCVFVLGSFVTELDIGSYFTNCQTYLYLTNAIFILRHDLPGVFGDNIYDSAVNGSLWTLPVEFLCYIACYCAYAMGILDKKRMKYTVPAVVAGYLILDSVLQRMPLLRSALAPCMMFYVGMLCFVYRRHINPSLKGGVLLSIACLILSTYFGILQWGMLIFLPYLLLYVAFGTKKKFGDFGKKHEISYGIYLCAFPIQQTIIMLYGGSMSPAVNIMLSVPLAVISGLAINVLIERPLLRVGSGRYQHGV